MEEDAQENMIAAVSKTSGALLDVLGKDITIPQEEIVRSSEDIVSSSSKVFEALYRSNNRHFEYDNTIEDKKNASDPSVKVLTDKMVESLHSVSEGVLQRMVPGQETINISRSGVSLQLERTTSDELSNKVIYGENRSFYLPSSKSMFPTENYSYVDLKVIEYTYNPFLWDTHSEIDSSIISVELYSHNATVIPQQNTSGDFTYKIASIRQGNNSESFRVPDVSTFNDTIEIPIDYEFVITNEGTNIRIFLSASKKSNATYIITIRHGIKPTSDNFDIRMVVPSDLFFETTETSLQSIWEQPDKPHDQKPEIITRSQRAYETVALNATTYEVFLPADYLRRLGTYHIQVAEYKTLNASGHPIAGRPSLPYAFQVHTSTCKHWNEETNRWSDTGCKVDPMSLPEETVCHCNHLTNFGVDSFFVPVNTIPWDELSFSALHDNPLVMATVFAILGVYFVLLVYMRRKDMDDILKWSATPLIDNRPGDNIVYHMTVSTGFKSGSGTRSNICFRIVGENSDTGIRQMKDETGKVFSGGSVNHFLLHVPENLGKLLYLHVWHDSSGLGADASWFLNRITVADIQSKSSYTFLCNRWLAVDKDDGKIDRVLAVSGKENLIDFFSTFGAKRQKSLTDDHLWFSLFLRPTRSIFTRVQRLACCLSLLFAYLISNAMFYKTDTESEKTSYTMIRFGPIQFSLQQIYIGMVSGLIVVPVNLIIITIFRKSRRCHRITIIGKCLNKVFRKVFSRRSRQRTVYGPGSYTPLDLTTLGENKGAYMLPWWCIYIAWAGVFLVTTTSAVFVIMYSMAWGKEKSKDWLASCTMSLFESMLLLEPFKAIGVSFVISLLIRSPDIEKDEVDDGEQGTDTDKNEDVAKRDILDSVLYEDSPHGPLKSNELDKIKERRTREKQLSAVLYGILVYFVFVAMAIVLCYHVKDPLVYSASTNLKNTYIENDPNFLKIRRAEEFWEWMELVFIPNIYPANTNVLSNVTQNGRYYRIHNPRIRQQRRKKGACVKNEIGKQCEHFEDTETANFDPRWQPFKPYPNSSSTHSPWTYRSPSEVYGTNFFGHHDVYGTEGYLVTLPSGRNSSLECMRSLAQMSWIDIHTRIVLIEFDLYIPDHRLFSSIAYALEFQGSGSIDGKVLQHMFRALNLFNAHAVYDNYSTIIFMCWMTFGVFAIILLVSLCRRICRQGRFFLKLPWNYFDVLLTVMTFMSVGLFVLCDVQTASALKVTRAGTGQNLQKAAALNDLMHHILAVVVFLAIIRFLKLLRFNRRMMLLSKTIKEAGDSLTSCIVMMAFFITTFAQMGYLLFHVISTRFHSVHETIRLLLTVSIGKFPKLESLESPDQGVLFFLTAFALFNMLILMNIFIAIVNEAFTAAKNEISKGRNYFEIVDYLTSRLKDAATHAGIVKDKTFVHKRENQLDDRLTDIDLKLDKLDQAVERLLRNNYKQSKRN
ncbi:polycystin-1-like protein 2 [Ptychodera flava]|uniref:polycystin-1-like protein 2 n=1 Tax=Ptychodera flava TaxID=63121 RepID=UPI003969EBCA